MAKRRPRVTRNVRGDGFQNPTTHRSSQIHRPGPDGKAACGWYLRGIVYAELSPNCRKCDEESVR